MKLRNPWIDPRVSEIHPAQACLYLSRHGWKDMGLAENPNLRRFEQEDENAPTLFVPIHEAKDDGAILQWMIELIGDLASWERRFAGDVLGDILQSPGDSNGTIPTAIEPVAVRPVH